ncbi:recombinase RecT [Streptomyces sp. NPDC059452]|uniref:recombinase RecT n=1 Tax=Streptomyces sp. NPDC059452 TaxID=3346835 RepID=UPI0036AE7193
MTDEPSAEPATVEGAVVDKTQTASPVVRPSAVVLRADQTEFDARQIGALAMISPGLAQAPRAQLAIFFHYCVRTGLDPFARQIYMIGRNNWKAADDPDEPEKIWTIQTGIDGFRTVAHRAAAQAGEPVSYEDTVYYDFEGNAHDVWLAKAYPAAVKVTVLRGNSRFPFIARWDEFAPTYYDRKEGGYVVAKMWRQMPAHMVRKCAEAGSLRMAAPQDLSGLFVDEEMMRADAEAVVREAEDATRRLRAAAGLEASDSSGDGGKNEPADTPAAENQDAAKPAKPKRKRPAKKADSAVEQDGSAVDSGEAQAPARRKSRKAAASRTAS